MAAVLVDCNVVVVPAQGGEVVWVVAVADGPRDDVVGFEPVAGVAARDGAAPVPFSNECSDVGWDLAGGMRRRYWLVVLGDDDSDVATAQELFEGQGPDAGTELDLGPSLPASLAG